MECKMASRSLIIMIFSVSSLLSFTTVLGSKITTCPDINESSSSCPAMAAHTKYIQKSENRMIKGRRFLGGLGSSPPQCLWKCGNCKPCKAVHVPVSPGKPVTAEYYPEAWRCKCGKKLYMP